MTIAETGSIRDRRCDREPTLDEIITDPIVVALMQADSVEPETIKRLLCMAVSPFALRSEARRLREMAKTTTKLRLKRRLAAQSFDLAQYAEVIATWQENLESLRPSIERYRAMLAVGIDDPSQRRIIEQMLRDAEQLVARLRRQPSSIAEATEAIGRNSSNDRNCSRNSDRTFSSEGNAD